MDLLTLHHFGFLTASATDWLAENETLLGTPFKIFDTVVIQSQKVNITFVEQTEGAVLTELVEPWADNLPLNKMIANGVTVYHKGFLCPLGSFDEAVEELEKKGAYSLEAFQSRAFGYRRCIFLVTRNLGLIELIEQ